MGGHALLLNTGRLVCFRNYEQIVKAYQDNPNEGKEQVSDEMKFNVFQGIMDSLFQSFNASISVTSFQELSARAFSWIEEHCKPQVSSGAAGGLLRQQRGTRQRPLRPSAPSTGPGAGVPSPEASKRATCNQGWAGAGWGCGEDGCPRSSLSRSSCWTGLVLKAGQGERVRKEGPACSPSDSPDT